MAAVADDRQHLQTVVRNRITLHIAPCAPCRAAPRRAKPPRATPWRGGTTWLGVSRRSLWRGGARCNVL
eukprot:4830729-Lingulodinium_polyedra.AAC.1